MSITHDHGASHWDGLHSPDEIADALIEIYRERGGEAYFERVTQTSHALQCGSLAMAAGSDNATVVAAFLHDVGHLVDAEEFAESVRGEAPTTNHRHEVVAERFLGRWFGDDVTGPIAGHVTAKRYLVTVEPEYHDTLSAASVRSLELQGGPMTPAEVERFEAVPGHDVAVSLRRWDDDAKLVGVATPDLDHFRDRIVEALRQA